MASVSVALILLSASALSSGCGLFGGDDEAPQVVEPPPAASQRSDSDTPTATATTTEGEESRQQQDQPTQAVAVTTAPADQEAQQEQAETASVSVETDDQSDPTIYVVQEGDTLAEIANRLGVRIDDLITLNGIQNPDVLQIGQRLKIPGAEASEDVSDESDQQEAAPEDEQGDEEQEEQAEPPSVELPTVAVPAATPTQVTYTQFPQPGPEVTSETIPSAPANFLQYGAAALPWLHGINQIDPIIELFKAWPMPPLAVGHDRIVLVDTSGDGAFSASIVFTDPNSFGAAVPYSNLIVYDPVPEDPSKYRIAYDHALSYAREVQGIQQLSDADLTGDAYRDLTFREITCDESGCVSSFYVLASTGDGYRTVTDSAAQVADVSGIAIEDRSGDGVLDIVVDGLAADNGSASRYRFIFSAQGDSLVELLRISLDGGSADEVETETDDEDEQAEEAELSVDEAEDNEDDEDTLEE